MTDLRLPHGLKAALILTLAVAALSACRDHEQGRVLMYEKGTYLGKKDTALSADVRAALEQRATLQATGSGASFTGTIGSGGPVGDVQGLGNRTMKQGGQ